MDRPHRDRDQTQAARDRERLVEAHLPLARALARRYANRGVPLEDLEQVAAVGLLNAVNRYDPSRGRELASFATPTIMGELRRHFRDTAWGMRVPRGLQEQHLAVRREIDALTVEQGATPSVAAVAERTGLSAEDVLDAIAAGRAWRPDSLQAPADPDAPDGGREERIGDEDPGFDRAEDRAVLSDALRSLPARERVIVHLRFARGLTQSEIAERVGISQMHVSRLLRRSIEALRVSTGHEPRDEPEPGSAEPGLDAAAERGA
jgi:RNA polymerase sigma-B factor